jgi:hypothetical protein
MNGETSGRLSPELATQLLSSILDGADGTIRLYFTVSTGAVVLFTNLIANAHGAKPVLAILVLSTFAFGGSALFCLRVLLGLVKLRTILAEGIMTSMSLEAVEVKVKEWTEASKKLGKWTEGLFHAGVVLAAIFITVLVFAR